MDAIDTSSEQITSYALLPNLKKYVTAIIVTIVVVILLGQLYQDHHRKEENLDTQRLHAYHQQYELVTAIIDDLQLIHSDEIDNLDYVSNHAREMLQRLSLLQDYLTKAIKQRHLEDDNKTLSEQERNISTFPEEMFVTINSALAAVEGNISSTDRVSLEYGQIEHHYFQYQEESHHFIENLSNYLQQESYKHRMTLWGIVVFIMLLVMIVGILFYRFISGLLKQQVELLQEDNLLRQQNEWALAEQEKKLRSILDTTVDAIITITEKGLIESFNKSAETMFAYQLDEVVGKNVKMLMPEHTARQHDGYLQRYVETGAGQVMGKRRAEVIGQRKDGEQFPMSLSLSEVNLPEGRLFTGVIQDITEQKKADEKLKHTLKTLSEKQQILEEEEKIAKHVFENITATNNDTLAEISSWSEPMGTFSGDLTLSTVLPSGGIRVLLCDFTGHGLPAALGAVPVSVTHSAMAKKDLPLDILMNELNNKLKGLLPTGIFCCIVGIDLDVSRRYAHIWNAGLPDVLCVSKQGEIKQRFSSTHLPLGVMKYSQDEMQCIEVDIESGDMIYAFSDGITEAENESGGMLGQARFEQLLMTETDDDGRLTMIRNEVSKFVGKAAPTDDLSLIEIKTVVTDEAFTLES